MPSEGDKCPVDHSARGSWAGVLPPSECPAHDAKATSPSSGTSCASPESQSPRGGSNSGAHPRTLATDRETSSIPRLDGEHWVYPSQAQFFAAMARKRHSPRESDMPVVVPIHNAVNERAWGEVMQWERGRGGEGCGGVRLVSFKGRPGEMSPRARWRSLLGYQAPFDRHDWVVDRCGVRLRYVIDFYTGKPAPGSGRSLAFYLDVRPALDSWEGVKMRAVRVWERWLGSAPAPVSLQAQASSGRSQGRSEVQNASETAASAS